MWFTVLLEQVDRKVVPITFDPHAFDRADYWALDLSKTEETVRFGNIFEEKCEEPNKICFSRYFGKENLTYIVITRIHNDFIEVKTIWPKKGR